MNIIPSPRKIVSKQFSTLNNTTKILPKYKSNEKNLSRNSNLERPILGYSMQNTSIKNVPTYLAKLRNRSVQQ